MGAKPRKHVNIKGLDSSILLLSATESASSRWFRTDRKRLVFRFVQQRPRNRWAVQPFYL
jgi:hypothetical protein